MLNCRRFSDMINQSFLLGLPVSRRHKSGNSEGIAMGIAIVILLVLAGIAAAVFFHMFRIVRIAPAEDTPEDLPLLPAQEEEEQELAGLEDYFGQGREAEAGKEPPPEEPEQVSRETDPLTELPSGPGFFIDCQRSLDLARQDGRACAVAYFDLDRFRFINSLKGVATGDYVLARIAQELERIFPEGALCTRLSADHFLALFPLTDSANLGDYTEQLRRTCEDVREHIGAKSGLRISMGVALTGEFSRDWDIGVLMNRANVARHCLKADKSELYSLFNDSMVETGLYGESALEDYGENQFDGEFTLYFQPQADLVRGRIVGGGARARWKCVDELPRVVPFSNEGRLPSGNAAVVYQTCRAISRWRKAGKETVPVTVGLSITDFYKEDLDAFLSRCLSEFQLESSALSVAVSASFIRMDFSMAQKQTKKIKELGVRIEVDGIDRSCTDLEFLSGLPVHCIKLQRGFSIRLQDNEERRAAVQEMLRMAGEQHIQVLFEGVDSQTQAEALRETGAYLAEGYFAGRPCLPEDFPRAADSFMLGQRGGNSTVILGGSAFARGNFNVY